VWVDAGPIPNGIAGTDIPAVRLRDGRVLAVSGTASAIYDPTGNGWAAAPSPIHVRDGAVVAPLADGRVLLAGGSYDDKDRKTTELFDPATRRWTAGPSMRRPRTRFQAVTLRDGRVLVVGGEGGKPSSAEVFDPGRQRWTVTGPPPLAAFGSSPLIVLRDGRVLAAGGAAEMSGQPSPSAEIFDPATNEWSAAADMIRPRADPGAILLLDGRVLVVGGERTFGGREMASAELFDPTTGRWSATPAPMVARMARAIALLADGRVLVAGGGNPAAGTMGAIETTEIFDPVSGQWSSGAPLRTARFGASAVALDDGSVLLVGGHKTGWFEFLGTSERYLPDGPAPH
jgi:hypothetical protein